MRGKTTLLGEGDFFGDDPASGVFVSHVKRLNDSTMTIDGDTTATGNVTYTRQQSGLTG